MAIREPCRTTPWSEGILRPHRARRSYHCSSIGYCGRSHPHLLCRVLDADHPGAGLSSRRSSPAAISRAKEKPQRWLEQGVSVGGRDDLTRLREHLEDRWARAQLLTRRGGDWACNAALWLLRPFPAQATRDAEPLALGTLARSSD